MIGFPRVVLAGAVDYAGLFPPASLPMPEVVAHYASYRAGPDAWALGRLVVPAARLVQCVECAAPHVGEGDPWRISALVPDPASLGGLAAFNAAHGAQMLVDAAEGKADTPEEVDDLAAVVPSGITVFVELAVNDRLSPCLARLKAAGLHAKIRTGGVVAAAIPPVEEVVRFMRACHEAGVAFKATAGLHHPLRGEYPLTYAADAPRGTMHGYLNAFAAAGALVRGATDTDLREVLSRSTRPTEYRGTADTTEDWTTLGHDARRLLLAFGSCSFREPLDELVPLGLAT